MYAVPAGLGAAVPALWASPAVIQEVLTCCDAHACIRRARDSVLTASRVDPREEERAFVDLQQAIAQLRTIS